MSVLERKSGRKIRAILCLLLLSVLLFFILPSIIISYKNQEIIKEANRKGIIEKSEKTVFNYDWTDLYNILTIENEEEIYNIEVENENNIVYKNSCNVEVNLNVSNFEEDTYKVEISVNDVCCFDEYLDKEKKKIKLDFTDEGRKIIHIKIFKEKYIKRDYLQEIYYIEPYQKQFLDELNLSSVNVHYRTGNYENYQLSIPLLKNLGVNYIRTDFFWGYIYGNGKYDYSKYDKWIEYLEKNAPNTKILAILNSNATMTGDDKKIDTNEELEAFVEFCSNIALHYPQILDFQILNEPNGIYTTEEDIMWYNKVILEVSKALKVVNEEIKIVQGSLSSGLNDKDEYLSSKTYFDKIFNEQIYVISNAFSYNVYYDMEVKLKNHTNQFNDFGGFIKHYITEYGSSMYDKGDIQQAKELIYQTCLLDEYQIDFKNIYNFWDTSDEENLETGNYGLLDHDYTPKSSYYIMKNYYQNVNGGEYIGKVDFVDGLEAHIYDKDGKTKMVVWAKDAEKNIEINYQNFIAKDLYGKEIENINGKLIITQLPIYLENLDVKYFYQAISNTAVKKYEEFQEKFAEQIYMVEELSIEIENQKQYMKNIKSITNIVQSSSIEAMENHYNLGNKLIKAYEAKELNIEYVKLSSMLDMLDDIGNSYEDLVTVSATTRNANIEETKQKIETVGKLIEDNKDLEIIYPSKILDFSKEYYDKTEYINGLEEENNIKTGLIVSKNLHANLLADWSALFTNLYIDEYIEKNPVKIEYSTQELTNQNVTATLKTNADIQITNNSGKNQYIFENNGTFIFSYTIRGKEKTIKSTVTNIDKTPPTIISVTGNPTNWTKNKVTLTVNASDSLSGLASKAYSFDNGATWQAENTKTYTENTSGIIIKVKDKLDNISTYETINITKIATVQKPKTTVESFKKNTTINEIIKIVDKNENDLKEEDIIKTGNKIKTIINNEEIILTTIVIGDTNGDGQADFKDMLEINKHRLDKVQLKDEYLLAGDVTDDGNVDFKDLLQINKYRLGKIDIL